MLLRLNRHYRDPFGSEPFAWALALGVALGVIAAAYAARGAEPDTRPVVTAYVSKTCRGGQRLEADVKAGKLDRFRVVFVRDNPPDWLLKATESNGWCPTLHYSAADGRGRRFTEPWGKGSAERFTARWEHWNRSKGGQ